MNKLPPTIIANSFLIVDKIHLSCLDSQSTTAHVGLAYKVCGSKEEIKIH